MGSSYDSKPWYIQKKKSQINLLDVKIYQESWLKKIFNFINAFKEKFILLMRLVIGLFCAIASGFYFNKLFLSTITGYLFFLYLIFSLIFLLLAIYFIIAQVGYVCLFFIEKKYNYSYFTIGLLYLKSKIEKPKIKKGLFASELVLRQFLQQVRLYSSEKNYTEQKQTQNMDVTFCNKNLKRRWHDIQDTLDEFDIYLAQNSQDIIAKLTANVPYQLRDVSHIFHEIAEAAETTWCQKGIRIEHAIVVPLQSNINEKLLRRLISGPWRACAFLCVRAHGVVFSVKTEKQHVVARWECEDVTFPNSFFELIKNQNLSLNERIEQSMEIIVNDPKNSNTIFGLISLMIWHDLAVASPVTFTITQENNGMVIKLKI